MKLSKEIKEDLKAFLKDRLVHREVRAHIVAPYELSESEVQHITSKIPLIKGLPVDIVVDQSILAGFVVRVGSKQLDYSLNSKVDSLFDNT